MEEILEVLHILVDGLDHISPSNLAELHDKVDTFGRALGLHVPDRNEQAAGQKAEQVAKLKAELAELEPEPAVPGE